MHIKKGDDVIVIAGKDKGAKGKVLRAFPKKDQVLVEGVNKHWKHQKPRKSNEKGQRLEMPMPIHVSNVKKADAPKAAKPKKAAKPAAKN